MQLYKRNLRRTENNRDVYEVQAKASRYENDNKAAVTKYSTMLGYPISESTVRGLKKHYFTELERVKDLAMVKKLHRCKAGITSCFNY